MPGAGLICVCVCITIHLCIGIARAAPTALVLSGQPAPGAGDGVVFSRVGSPVVGDAGHVSFVALLAGSGVDSTNDSAYFASAGGAFQLVAREGDLAAAADGARFGEITYISNVNSAGHVAFRNELSAAPATTDSIWTRTGGAPQLIARAGGAVQDLPAGTTFVNLSVPSFNGAGQVGFHASFAGPGVNSSNNSGYFVGAAGAVQPIIRRGDPVPGAPAGVVFDVISPHGPNPQGRVAAHAWVRGTGVNDLNRYGVWTGAPGTGLQLLARSGDPAPGAGDGVTFRGYMVPTLNAVGSIVFTSYVDGPGVHMFNSNGIWAGRPGDVDLLIRAGAHAPGTEHDVNFINFGPPSMNSAGHLAFYGNLTGASINVSNRNGLWAGPANAPRLIARKGMPAPGTGMIWDRDFYTSEFVLNEAGEFAFQQRIGDRNGIWLADPRGQIQLIAWEGLPLRVAEDDLRIPEYVSFLDNANDAGRWSGFNDRGELLFEAIFTDGSSGIFRVAPPLHGPLRPSQPWITQPIPDPAGAAIFVFALLGFIRRRVQPGVRTD